MRLARACLTLALVAAPFPATIAAQAPELTGRDRWADSARLEIEAAATEGNLPRLAAARALIDRALAAFPEDPLLLHYKGYALYREAGILQGLERPADARPLLQEADDALERSARELAMPETHALRSSVLGQLIGTSRNPFAGTTLGPRASAQMDRALELGPDNPRVWMLRGSSAIFTPSLWGGGADKAEQYLKKSLALYAGDHPAPPAPAWGHADAYLWLGQAHQRQDRRDAARDAYRKALELQPGNQWVLKTLLPGLDETAR